MTNSKILIVCFFCVFLPCTGYAGEVGVEFYGKLIADPCVVSTDSEYQVIEFGPIASKTFINHSRSSPKTINITLQECDLDLGTSVRVKFTGDKDNDQPDSFKVVGNAEGVAISLEGDDGEAVKPDEYMHPVLLKAGETLIKLNAYVQASTYNKVKEGSFESTVTFHLEYE